MLEVSVNFNASNSDSRDLIHQIPNNQETEKVLLLRRQQHDRKWKYLALFLITLITTTMAGGCHYLGFIQDFGSHAIDLTTTEIYLNGLWYSLPILAILGAHEMGHYLTCRYYNVDTSLPYFLPAPIPLTGTLGAFIRIRQPIPTKQQLFDIGIAGPIAGFVIAIPVLLLGIGMSRATEIPVGADNLIELGEPLLFQFVIWLEWGTLPPGHSINMHPMAFAAWFGLLATALNLFPIGQLDGGHISYTVLGRRSSALTLLMVFCLIGLSFVSSSWAIWTFITIGMLLAFGLHHPRTTDEDVPLDRNRMYLAVFALVMFILCFTPSPIQSM